jgi:transcriptional regulator with XRE-family HTH domain
MMTIFGAEIKSARENLNLSLSEAADLIGCTKAHVWDLEQGKANNPTIRLLAGLAVTYGISLSYLAETAAISSPGVEHRTAVANYMKARLVLNPPIKSACETPKSAVTRG